MDTIYALSSGALPSAVAIVRVSGPKVTEILEKVLGFVPEPRRMHYGVFSGLDGTILDESLVVYFKGPHSYTGEDCAEFHLHGGRAVVNRFLEELAKFEDCRLAEPGEFSKRAFHSGKMDLTQAEGLSDLLAAETEGQRRMALSGASGALAAQYRNLRKQLLQARALCEAAFDFSEEEDIHFEDLEKVWGELEILRSHLKEQIIYGEQAQKARDGFNVVLLGAPNSGKSSFINKIFQRELALVSSEAGTTRDVIEGRLVLGGFPVFVNDTAGIRRTDNKVEELGISRALERLVSADLVLYLEEAPKFFENFFKDIKSFLKEIEIDDALIALEKLSKKNALWFIKTKTDLLSEEQLLDLRSRVFEEPHYFISITEDSGFREILDDIERFILNYCAHLNHIMPARERQIFLLRKCLACVDAALEARILGLEYVAEHLRLASHQLGKITGDIDIEDVLDVIFSQFCVGK